MSRCKDGLVLCARRASDDYNKVNECLSTTESTLGAAGKGLDGLPTTSVVGKNTGRTAPS